MWFRTLFAILCLALAATRPAEAATVPVGFQDRQIATGFTSPTALTVLPDGRVLAVQQNGVIKVIKGDVLLGTNFWSVPNVDSSSERGCLGIIADPNFATNKFVYIYCTIKNATGSNNRVIRVTEAADKMVPGSEVNIFQLPNVPTGTRWHMGGALRFGTDGKLYVAVGNHEDSPQSPTSSHSQNLSTAFGKILRINADGTIPSDNPFFTSPTGAYKAIWNYGHRNPFAFDIQPGTGRLFSGDVGQSTWEEVNDGVRGGNYGWPYFEGPETDTRFITPFYAYNHNTGGCSITGVAFYNPPTAQFPSQYVGKFLFQDFCAGYIKTLDPTTKAVGNFVTGIGFPTNMAIAPDGSLYYLARNQQTGTPQPGGGSISKIIYTGSQAPRITLHPESQTVGVGDPVTFRAAADGATSFQWQRNGANISGATSTTYTLSSTTLADSGARFRIGATNSFGTTFSSEATLTVSSNRFPVASIVNPVVGTQFNSGDVINYSGTGTDPEDGALPGTSLTWQVDFQHDSHTHPFMPPTSGASGSFTVPSFENEANTWMRIHLTATDSGGLTHSVFRDIFPGKQVSSMTPIGTPINGFGPMEINKSNGESAAGDGKTITIGGLPFLTGLGVHAPSEVRYNIAGCSGSFIADVGIDDEVAANGSVIFQVFLDGVKAYESAILRGTDPRANVIVSVAGKTELRLVVTDAGDGKSFDHADWAAARVTGCSGAPPVLAITNLSVKDTTNAADWSVRSNLQTGNQVFGDRTYTFESVPASLAGSAWIRPAADSKAYTGNPLVTFSINVAANVYVAVDDRIARPAWIDASWTDTGENLLSRESTTAVRTMSVYRKSFVAGTVSLGPQSNTAAANYVIVVK